MAQLRSGVPRRSFLRSQLALGAASHRPDLCVATSASPCRSPLARSVITWLQEGGMSQLESWDPKPAGSAEIRGIFKSIATTQAVFRIGEHMPRLARKTALYNVVRSVTMDNTRRDHSPGLHWLSTAYDHQAAGVSLEKVNRSPSVGAVLAHQPGTTTADGLSNFVAIPNARQLGNRVRYTGALHLGAACDAFDAGPIPATATGKDRLPQGLTLPADIAPARLRQRRLLLAAFAERDSSPHREATNNDFGAFQVKSHEILASRGVRYAFDLNQEPPHVREMYGASAMGQGTLLARRLVEAGVSYVLANHSEKHSWDTHNDNFNMLTNTLLPPMDQAVSALLGDLQQRGMLDEVLVLGEMGRTPRINKHRGRDHWPDLFSLLIAGGGLTRGRVLGSSSRHSGTLLERPVHHHEILATINHQLGIDPNQMVRHRRDRPVRIMPEAKPLHELLA